MSFYDDDVLRQISYYDINNKLRIKPPYKNQIIQNCFVQSIDGKCIINLGINITGKSVVVNFIDNPNYNYTVDATKNTVTIFNAPNDTFIEIKIIDPTPIPKSDNDLFWDNLSEDQRRAIMSTWTDIICIHEYNGSSPEWGYDDRNVPRIFGWVNNYGNTKQPIPTIEWTDM